MASAQHEFFGFRPVESRGWIDVHNPADQRQVVGQYPAVTGRTVEAAVGAAAAAQPGWAALPPAERYRLLIGAASDIDTQPLAGLLTQEHGKVIAESRRELGYLTYPLDFLGEHVPWLEEGDDLGDSGTFRSRIYPDPFGVVGVVVPWNNPIGNGIIVIAPALLAGNTVVGHLPPTAALAALDVYRRIAARLPEGVLSMVTSPDPTVAQALVEHPTVRHVHFTGSTAIGRLVATEAATTLATVTLELGGNDAAIVLDDAIGDGAIYDRIARGAFGGVGQACVALKRLYVPRPRVGEVVDALGAVLDRTVVGDGLDAGTTMGPLHTARIRDRVVAMVDAARAAGGTVHEFGTLKGDPEHGYFLRPTLVTGVGPADAIVRDEQFGPTLPVIGYDSVDDAIAQANDSEYGLGGSVWSADVERAATLARRLEAGMTWVNVHGGPGIDGRVPWGGVKCSGVGRGGSNRAGLDAFTEPHAVIIPSAAATLRA